MPPEWAPHRATWLSWPHNRDTWPGCFDQVEPAMVQLVAALAPTEPLYINVLNAAHEAHVRKLLRSAAPANQISYWQIPTNDAWVRDHGPVFVVGEGVEPMLAVDFEFNSWGGKYPPFDLDNQAAAHMAAAIDVPAFALGTVLEGGSIDVNGGGALMTTEQCLLNPNRNPDLDRAAIEQVLAEALGVQQIIWLGHGIQGDDTDGHVDDLARFVAAETVVAVAPGESTDPDYAPLRDNLDRLAATRVNGRPLTVLELPSPEPQYHSGRRLPASYANFYVANGVVLQPGFDCAADEQAAEVLAACFPSRRIMPIDCRVLVAGLGALHCLTQQVPTRGGHN